jgi:hypothetical protein
MTSENRRHVHGPIVPAGLSSSESTTRRAISTYYSRSRNFSPLLSLHRLPSTMSTEDFAVEYYVQAIQSVDRYIEEFKTEALCEPDDREDLIEELVFWESKMCAIGVSVLYLFFQVLC